MILEVHLDHLVRESEHDGMTSPHPLLNIHNILNFPVLLGEVVRDLLVRLRLLSALEVAAEVLQKGHLLLEVLGVLCQGILFADVLAVGLAPLHVVEVEAIGVQHDLGTVVKEDTGRLVGQVVAQTVFRGVVNPLLDPDFALGSKATLGRCTELVVRSSRLLGGKSIRGDFILVSPRN